MFFIFPYYSSITKFYRRHRRFHGAIHIDYNAYEARHITFIRGNYVCFMQMEKGFALVSEYEFYNGNAWDRKTIHIEYQVMSRIARKTKEIHAAPNRAISISVMTS